MRVHPRAILLELSEAHPKYGKLPFSQNPSQGDRSSQYDPKYPSGHSQVACVSLRATQVPLPEQSMPSWAHGFLSHFSPCHSPSQIHCFWLTAISPPRYRAAHAPCSPQSASAHKSISHDDPAKPALHLQVLEPQSQYELKVLQLHSPGHSVASITPACWLLVSWVLQSISGSSAGWFPDPTQAP